LASLGKPVLLCRAEHNSRELLKRTLMGWSKRCLSIAEGARVMITRNVWTSKGFVNGGQGVVKKIWFLPTVI
ncbi:hypothetical protein R3P38DRAFT_2559382, partial [Favolaschia claudopus]